MSKQNYKIYSALIDRIAISMATCQAIILIFNYILSLIEAKLAPYADNITADVIFLSLESLIYFIAFFSAVNIFNKMNKNAPREIYEPVGSEKMSGYMPIFSIGFFLGLIILFAFTNKLLLGEYSVFAQYVLWQTELKHLYQIFFYIAMRVILPAFLEEYFFRGTVCKKLSVYGKGTAILVSASLFAIMHADFSQLLYTFAAGALLGFLYVETENIIYPILLHLLNNGIWAALEIVWQTCDIALYYTLARYAMIVITAASLICAAFFISFTIKKGELIGRFVLKPDENGNEVKPLNVRERVSGFFSKGVILYLIYALFRALYLVYLSMQ